MVHIKPKFRCPPVYIYASRSFSGLSTSTQSSVLGEVGSISLLSLAFSLADSSGYFFKFSMAQIMSLLKAGGILPCPDKVPSPAISKNFWSHSRVSPFSHSIWWKLVLCILDCFSRSDSHACCSAREGSGVLFLPAQSLARAMAWYSKLRNVRTRGSPTMATVGMSCKKVCQ